MQRWNFKHVSIYSAVIFVIIVYSIVISKITINQDILQIYQRILFAAPLLFIIAAFLAFKIAETGIVLIALSFLVLTFSQQLMMIPDYLNLPSSISPLIDAYFSSESRHRFFSILPLILPFSLSIIFLIPDRFGNFSLVLFKVFFAFFPLIFFLFPNQFEALLLGDIHYGRFMLPLPSLVASIFSLAGPYFYSDRRTGTFSVAITFALILFMLPIMILLDGYLKSTCYLFAGIILLYSLYRVYWENSYIDELTGLYNRRALDERMRRLRHGYSLAMVDIDHFKNFNDTYGHDEGDNVLRLVSRILYTHFDTSAYRYGGEEFCIIFLKTSAESAAQEMDDARSAIEKHGFSIRQNVKNRKKSARKKTGRGVKKVKLTVSAGIAAPGKARHDATDILKMADKALYIAKENGRNRVEISRIRN